MRGTMGTALWGADSGIVVRFDFTYNCHPGREPCRPRRLSQAHEGG